MADPLSSAADPAPVGSSGATRTPVQGGINDQAPSRDKAAGDPVSIYGSSRYEVNPLVSIIIPLYNAEPFLDETLQSVADQTYRPLEVDPRRFFFFFFFFFLAAFAFALLFRP